MSKNIIFLLIWIAAYGCYWENEETLYPDSGMCDTTFVSYSEDIVPILTNNCYVCHSNQNAPDKTFGLALENYEDVVSYSAVIPHVINQEKGYLAMPRNTAKLDACLINKIEAWINDGSPDN